MSSISNFSADLSDSEFLKQCLCNIPTNRVNFYFESKAINGFKTSLQEEIQDLLVFIERNEKIISEKDEIVFNLTNEHEKNIMKFNFGKNSTEPLIQENQALLDKIELLNKEIEILDSECLRYEGVIDEIYKEKRKLGEHDYERFFLKNLEKIQKKFPYYFCTCKQWNFS